MLGKQFVTKGAGVGSKNFSSISRGSSLRENDENDNEEGESVKLWSFFSDRRRFAWSLLSILKNNIVTAPFYYILLTIEYLELLFLYMIFAFLYFKNAQSELKNKDSFVDNISERIESSLNFISSDQLTQVIIVGIMLFKNLAIILSVMSLAQHLGSPEKAKNSNICSKLLSATAQINSKVIFTIEFILLTQIFKNNNFINNTGRILILAGTILSLILTVIIEFVMNFILNIRVRLVNEIPWCAQKSVMPLLKSLFKLLNGVCLTLAIPQATAIVLFLVASLNLIMYIYMQPQHNKRVYYLDIIFLSILFVDYFHLLVASFESNIGNQERLSQSYLVTVLLFFVCFLIPAFANILALNRQETLQNNLLLSQGQIKSEFEIEKALVLFTECLERSGRNGSSSSSSGSFNFASAFGISTVPGLSQSQQFASNEFNTALNKQITGLILYHRERCREFKRGTCFCMQFDDSLLANRLIFEDNKKNWDTRRKKGSGQLMDQEMTQQTDKKRAKAKVDKKRVALSIGEGEEYEEELKGGDDDNDEDSYISAKSLNRRELLRKNATDNVERKSTNQVEKEQDWQQEEQKQYLKGILNPLFQAEYFISQSVMNQKKQQSDFESLLPEEVQRIVQKHNSDLAILDFGTIKVQTVINILYRIIRDYCDQNPKSLRLMLFRVYFELFVMRKKYLAHQTLTRIQGEDTLGLISYTQFQLDQQYLVEKAQILYQTKDDQLIDVDKIITQNHHYQHFYDLNEETAYQLNIFWAQLSNVKNVDIEKLFESGVKTSDLIKQTKDKFQTLIQLGIEKRNSNLYYLYANFNKYVLNSNDQYNEYIYKMKQIQSMNKTIQDTQYKDQLNADVDKSGFLLVKGTYHEFGKIIYANRQLCSLLGYKQEQLNTNGKIINVLMPQIISEHHAAFLSIFRESGIPVFIQRMQQLFIKDAQGYIRPFKVYIKFHYDMQYGHVFCAIVNRTKHFHPFKNKKKINCDEVMTIMTDEVGTICEISPSVSQNLGIPIKFVQQNQMFLQDNVKIWHMFKMDPKQLEDSSSKEIFTTLNPEFHSDSDSGKPIFAAQHALFELIKQHQRNNVDLKSTKSSIKSQIEALSANGQLQVDVKVKMAKVCHKDILIVRYFFIEIQDNDHFFNDQDGLAGFGNVSQNRINVYQNRLLESIEENMSELSLDASQEVEEQKSSLVSKLQKKLFDDNSSTNSDSMSKFADLIEKDIDQLIRNDSRAPKFLKQILWLVLFAFFVTTIISAIITGIFVRDSEATKGRLSILTSSLDRGIYSAQVMNMLRSLIDVKTSVENNDLGKDTQIWQSIQQIKGPQFTIQKFLSDQIISKLDNLKATQQTLDIQNHKNMSLDTLNIAFLNSQGSVDFQKQPSNVAINVIVSNIIYIVSNIDRLDNLKILRNITYSDYFTYYNQIRRAKISQTESYSLLELQKQIFFVFENFVKVLDQFNTDTSSHYLQDGQQPLSATFIQQFLILICIGIGSITIILFVVSPITFKIRRQKYQVLLFFMRLDDHIIKQSCLKSTIFEEKFTNDHFNKHGNHSKLNQVEGERNGDYQTDNDDEFSSHDYINLEPAEQDETEEFDEEIIQLSEEGNDNSSSFNGKALENIKRKRELTIKLDAKINAINAKKATAAEKRKGPLVSNPTKFNESDFSLESNYDEANNPRRFSDQNAFINQATGNQTPNIASRKVQQVPKKNKSEVLQPMLLESANKLQKKNFDKAQIKNSKTSFRNSMGNQSKKTANLPVITEEENKNNTPNSSNVTFANTETDRIKVQDVKVTVQKENEHDENNEQDIDDSQIVEEDLRTKEELEKKTQKISTSSQSGVLMAMLLLFIFISAYFVGIYVYSRVGIQDFRQSFDELYQIHERGVCISKLMFYAREDMLSATEAKLSDSFSEADSIIQGYRSSSMNQLWRCMELEQQYTDIKRNSKFYLKNVDQLIADSDSSKLCNLVAQYSGQNYTVEMCKRLQNQVFTKGLSLAHQDFIKSVLIQMLDYFSRVPTFARDSTTKKEFITQKLKQPPFLEYLYANDLLLSSVNQQLNIQASQSILRFIDLIKNIHIALFVVLQVILMLITIYFFCYLFNRMKKDMLSSHTMIGMLPKHLLQRKDQMKIRQFLMS